MTFPLTILVALLVGVFATWRIIGRLDSKQKTAIKDAMNFVLRSHLILCRWNNPITQVQNGFDGFHRCISIVFLF